MGFASGFTGGVTLTLGIAYLAVQAHQRNRQAQGELVRAQTHLLNATTAPSDARLPDVLSPPSRTEQPVISRIGFVETAKDRWNHEVLRLARLVQSRDAAEAIDEVEGAVVRGLAKAGAMAVDNGVPAAAESTKGAVASLVDKAKAAVERAQDKLSGAVTKGSGVVAAEKQLSAVEMALRQRFESREGVLDKSVEEALRERYMPIEEQNHTGLRGL